MQQETKKSNKNKKDLSYHYEEQPKEIKLQEKNKKLTREAENGQGEINLGAESYLHSLNKACQYDL